jgi:two-component system cell cycle sensor histidine kinase/response regulator CckA
MGNREALKLEPAALDPLTVADGFGGYLSTIFVVAAAAAVVFGLFAAGSGEPLLLTILAVLAMLGLFMLFALAAGHMRIGARLPAGDVLKAALDASDEPALVASASGNVFYWNPAQEAMFGRSESGPLAALESAFGSDPECSQAFFRLNRAAERAEFRREEIRLKSTPAAPRRPTWLRITVRPFASPERDVDAKQRDTLVLWQIADITDERTREAQRVGGLEAALAGFDSMPMGFLSVAPDGTVLHVNATFEGWLGFTRGEVRARSATLADLAGEDGARLLSELARETEAGRRAIDLDLSREDGRIVPLTLYAEPAGAGFTLTALNRALSGLSDRTGHSEIRFSHFFQSAPFGIATLDRAGRIASANTAFLRMLPDGRPQNGALAVDVLGAHADEDERSKIVDGLSAILSGRGNVAPIDFKGGEKPNQAGSVKEQLHRRAYMSPLASAAGEEAAALYLIDTTEQKVLEARVVQAQKMEAVGKLAGGIAHDFNNVLTAIIGNADLLLKRNKAGDPAYKDLMNIRSAALRAAGLVANLLGFSRKQTQQVTLMNLGEVLTDLTPILKTSVGEKIDLRMRSERDLWYVKADKTQIDNVIINLCVNARDAMPGGGKLTLRTRNVTEREAQKMEHAGFTPGEYVLIEVEDSGTGMSPEVMAKIFEPFFTTKAIGKGTGLGLASVYGIVKQSGGFILPESEVGKGTTFRVYLPRYIPEDDEIEAASPAAKQATRLEGKSVDLTGTGCVLLVEDEVDVRQFAVRALRLQGYKVLEASDGLEALEIMKANEGQVDIVVSDVVMPEMDGPTLFKELRKDNPSIKVIFVSGYPNEAFRESLGSDDFAFLPKPFSLPQLALKVKEEIARQPG